MVLSPIFAGMSNRVLYSFVFVFLTALTVNVAHEVVEHERSVCEVCLHAHVNHDADVATEHSTDIAPSNQLTHFVVTTTFAFNSLSDEDTIRGPPLFA